MAQAALDNLNASGIEQPKASDGTSTPIANTADTGYFTKKRSRTWRKWASTRRSPQVDGSTIKHWFRLRRTPSVEAHHPRPKRVRRQRSTANCVRRLVKLSTPRKHIVEPLFGMIKSPPGIRKFLLRGLGKCRPTGN